MLLRIRKVVGIVTVNRCEQLGQRLKHAFLLVAIGGVVCFAAAILHRYLVAHLLIHPMDLVPQLALQIYVDFIRYSHFFKLQKCTIVANQSLSLISPIKAINTVGSDDASLNFNLPNQIRIHCLVKLSFAKL